MIGLDFPVKPQWIHDVHHLWRPAQPISELIQAALAQTMQELGGKKTRRNSLTIILRYFVTVEGGGQARHTAERDVWVAYSRAYPASTLAPAYLAQLVAQNEFAEAATRFIAQRYVPGDALSSAELRHHVSALFGQRSVVTNAASAFLRSLQAFGVLEDGDKVGAYRYVAQLSIAREIFPLLIWAWWQRHKRPQLDVQALREDPAFAFLETSDLDAHWRAYQPALWVLEERLEGRRAVLKYADAPGFAAALLAADGSSPVGEGGKAGR